MHPIKPGASKTGMVGVQDDEDERAHPTLEHPRLQRACCGSVCYPPVLTHRQAAVPEPRFKGQSVNMGLKPEISGLENSCCSQEASSHELRVKAFSNPGNPKNAQKEKSVRDR